MQVLIIIISLGLLMFLAYRGVSVLILAPLLALLAGIVSGMPILPTYTEIFLPSLAGFVKVYFPFILLGAIFGKVMDESGAAKAIAKMIIQKLGKRQALLAVVLSSSVLAYGGVSVFVVAFAVYPFAASIFKEADIPKRLIPACIALGSWSYTMDALPGTPQVQNAIPMQYFNTDLYAAPVFGILGAIIMFVVGVIYLEWRKRKAQVAGEGYGENHSQEPEFIEDKDLPNPYLSVIPLLSILVISLILQKLVFPYWDIAGWVTKAPYNLSQSALVGTMNNWALIIAMFVGIILNLAINPGRVKGNMMKTLNVGAIGSLLAVMNVGSEVGYGTVIQKLPGFQTIGHALMGINAGGSPLLSEAVTVNTLAGITGSASGGLGIALATFGKEYLDWAHRVNISPELLHRVAAMASGGFDTLPHNGAVIVMLGIAGLTHKQAYKDIFAVTLLKFATVFVLIGLQSIFHFV